jgi:hypothetical protein
MGAMVDIPDEAKRAACAAFEAAVLATASSELDHERPDSDDLDNHEEVKAAKAAAPLIVAAELERLIEDEAVNVNENGHQWRGIDVEDLRDRAAELRGEG